MTLDAFLRMMNDMAGWPNTPATLAVQAYWAQLEGIDNPRGLSLERGWNPWMTTWPNSPDTRRSSVDIGFGPGKWNNANPPLGVGMYATPEDGARATIKTIRALDAYAPIDGVFRNSAFNPNGFQDALETWIGSPAYALELTMYAMQQYGPADKPLTLDEIATYLGGASAIRKWNEAGNSLTLGYSILQEQSQEIANRVAALDGLLRQPLAQVYTDIGRAISQAGAAIDSAGKARASNGGS